MLEALRSRLRDLLDERAAAVTSMDEVLDAAAAEQRADLTSDEAAAIDAARSQIAAIDEQASDLEARISELEADAERSQRAAELRDQLEPTRGEQPVRRRVAVGAEERVYRPDGEHSFFRDAYASRGAAGSVAADRLARHLEQEREQRDVGTSAFGGLVVPQYLTDEFAPVLRDGRAFLNAVRQVPLPDEGTSFIVPRGQTGVSVAAQASQGDAVSETNADYDNDLTVTVSTYAGQQDVSRQALERGTPGIDQLLYADLAAAYAEAMDTAAITATLATSGINAVTYTDASPTVPEAWPKLADATQQVASNRKLPASLHVMHPRRWGWFVAALDSTNRPLIVADPGAAINAMGEAMAANFGEGQLAGTLGGLPVVLDANISTALGGGTEDAIITMRASDPVLWEVPGGAPRELRFEDADSTGSLEVKLLVYGYSAFTAGRWPTGVSKITGTGLAAPTF